MSTLRWIAVPLAVLALAGCGPKQPVDNPPPNQPPAPGKTGALTPGQPPGSPTTGAQGTTTTGAPPPGPAQGGGK